MGAAVLLLAGCSDASQPDPSPPSTSTSTTGTSTTAGVVPDLGSPDLSAPDRAACDAFVAALPTTISGRDRLPAGDVVGAGPGAAYGDPAIIARCGVATPTGFDPTRVPGPDDPSPCILVNGVGWFVPDDQRTGKVDATLTAVSFSPLVSVEVPRDYLPEGSAAALVELGPAVEAALTPAFACT